MAVVIKKSGPITNRDASPKVLSDNAYRGQLMEAAGTLETNGDDTAASTYIFCEIPSNARVSAVLLSCDGNNTSGAMDIGIYQNTANGSAVVDADHFASAKAIGTILKNDDVTHEAVVYGIEDIEKPLWEALGLSADSNRGYDVVATITTADDAADSLTIKVQYSI